MGIKILNSDLINKIAAGEVVERPASIVKELAENSIDAKASQITIEIQNGGIDFIQITDNGAGIDKNDIKLSIACHATSKIQSIEDLSHIQSFGFRGEALSSISSVSKIIIQSKKTGEISGSELVAEGENNIQIKDIGCPEGTKIKVSDIFYNVPARRKFLKNQATEYKHILDVMINFALIHPDISFKLIHNSKIVFDYHKKESWQDRVKEVLGQDNFKNLKYFNFEANEMALRGFVSMPVETRSNRNHQYLFVNNRQVYNNIINKAVYEAYSGYIPRNTHPIFVINIEIEPELVDINVHPRKIEVKFQNSQAVFQTVEKAVRNIIEKPFDSSCHLENINQFPMNHTEQSSSAQNYRTGANSQKHQPLNSKWKPQNNAARQSPNNFRQALEFNRQIFQTKKEPAEISQKHNILGQIKNTYILAEKESGLIIIDQHAAHERMIYDQLKTAKNQVDLQQQLLLPIKLELGIKEIEAVKENLKILKDLGFDIEEFGANTIILNSVPSALGKQDNLEEIIKNIISDIKEDFVKTNSLEEKRNKILKYASCRSAIKAGDRLNYEMREKLAAAVLENKVQATCPHGRPIFFELEWSEIEKRCKRR